MPSTGTNSGENIPRIEIDPDQCKGCELCTTECPKEVIEIQEKYNKLGYKYAQYKGAGCTGCTACYYACPEPGAITVYKK